MQINRLYAQVVRLLTAGARYRQEWKDRLRFQFYCSVNPINRKFVIIIEGAPPCNNWRKYGLLRDFWSRSESAEIWHADSSYMQCQKNVPVSFSFSSSREESLDTRLWNPQPGNEVAPLSLSAYLKKKKKLEGQPHQEAACQLSGFWVTSKIAKKSVLVSLLHGRLQLLQSQTLH